MTKYSVIFMFLYTQAMCQNNLLIKNKVEFGFSHSTYNSFCFQKQNRLAVSDEQITPHVINFPSVSQIRYGFALGGFLWIPITRMMSLKPQLENAFSNVCIFSSQTQYATSIDVNFSLPAAFALSPANKNGIIYLARNMSCYLTHKQPYLLIGPKCNFRKLDKGFINKGFQNEILYGFLIGYGINYEFHGTSFSPEIKYSIEASKQNKMNDSQTLSHTVCLAINLF